MQRLKFTSKVMYLEEKKALTMEQIATESNLLSTFSNQMADAVEREEDLSIQTHDNRTLPAQFAGRDLATDLAVLRVANLGLQAAAAASEPARVGQLVLAVGRSENEGPMASVGIVSAVGGPLRMARGATLERYIRTDAIPYPGFSGGPLINTQGEVLGITTTGLVNSATLAIPTAIAWGIAETLRRQGLSSGAT